MSHAIRSAKAQFLCKTTEKCFPFGRDRPRGRNNHLYAAVMSDEQEKKKLTINKQ